jgi:retron-type reverse transcriptase
MTKDKFRINIKMIIINKINLIINQYFSNILNPSIKYLFHIYFFYFSLHPLVSTFFLASENKIH